MLLPTRKPEERTQLVVAAILVKAEIGTPEAVGQWLTRF